MNHDAVFERHQNIALQFSGGKDSLAALYALRQYWDRLTVYFCDSGDTFPENREAVEHVHSLGLKVCIVHGHQPIILQEFGQPSDLVPYSSTIFGRNHAGDTGFPMVDRYTCCYESIMSPLQDAMKMHGITLIIRGQRNADLNKSTVRSGDILDGFEFLFPIQSWTDEDVMAYLIECKAPIPRFYKHGTHGFDCMGCTAWLDHGQGAYMKQYHSAAYARRQAKLKAMAEAVKPVFARLQANVT